jgi:DNA processing protein
MSELSCCPACARRSWLVGRLAGHLEHRRADRARIREVLALDDAGLIAALAGRHATGIAAEREALEAEALPAAWTAAGVRSVCRHDPAYPSGLADLTDAPAVMHVHGAAERLTELTGPEARAVAVVGARRASGDGLDLAAALGRGLAAAGLTVVSGMALGIDSAAHRGALETAGAPTVAVLACGPERAYPASRRNLHAELAQRALVVSELPPGTPAFRWAFPARNRLIAALAGMTVVVEAADRSGSLITAELAADLGRDVGAVPGSPSAWHAGGTNALLRDGAHVVRGVTDILDDVLGPQIGESGEPAARLAAAGLPELLAALLAQVAGGRRTLAALVADGASPGEVLAGLGELERLGLLERGEAGRYVVPRS